MKIKLAGWIALIFLGSIIIAGVWFFFLRSTTPQLQNGQQGGVTLPVTGGGTGASSTSPLPAGKIALSLRNKGSTIIVNDFIGNGVTLPDTVNPGRYLLAGNLGYCYPNTQPCEAAPAVHYIVYFNAVTSAFTIALTGEPLGEARHSMETFLLSTLGITKEQMCNVDYSVNVTRYVSEQYTGKNLGFSFCPGAMVLP